MRPKFWFLILACVSMFAIQSCKTTSQLEKTGPKAEPANLAYQKKARFSQAGWGTSPNTTDTLKMTDGKLCARPDLNMRADRPTCVNFNYPGLVQLSVDLGKPEEIGEVAIRFSGGSREQGTQFPVWVKLVASDDGVKYYSVAGYSRFTPGDQEKYGVPREAGKAFIHKLRFKDANIRARYVGIEFYGSAYFGTDELYVLAGDAGAKYKDVSKLKPCDFSITSPRMYFHKPYSVLANNLDAPMPIGMLMPARFSEKVTVTIDLPKGVKFVAGHIGGAPVAKAVGKKVDHGFTRYTFPCTARNAKDWSRVFIRDGAKCGKKSAMRYQLAYGNYQSPLMEQPIVARTMTSAPQPKRMMTGLVYVPMANTLDWPDVLNVERSLGFNILSVFSKSTQFDDPAVAAMIAKFRNAGFKIVNIDNSFEAMDARNNAEVTCQFGNGKHGRRICPSYRGPLYEKELQRISDEFAAARPDIFSPDIELWDSNGPTDSKRCTRCQADYKASGAKSWDAWWLMKGEEMIHDFVNTIRDRAKELGIKPPYLGVYDFRPNDNYNLVYPFNRFYPEWLDNSQVSTYTAYYPYNVVFTGNEARKDRQALPRTDQMPWLTPGDAGTFPGEMFTWALMECYANGSRGVNFWSSRMWDPELLDAHARATKMVAPVENVIIDGDLVKGVSCNPEMRVSGM
ncbi:hypothetical protein LLG95_00660, partial [bacterium]|nr:hypothetical protein [bacterium]